MTAGEGPLDAVADFALVGSARVWTAFTDGVDMARPIFRLAKTKSRASRAALNWTRQLSVIAAARAGAHYVAR
jgi:hypothetical protein